MTLKDISNGPDWIMWVVFAIFALMSIVLFTGRGANLIAGYNTASKEEKSKYDEKKLCRVTGVGMSVKQFKEEQLFTKAGNGEITSDTFLSMLGYDNPQFHMVNYIENYLTLDEGFIPFAEEYYKHYDFVLLSNDVSEWSEYITEYYQLNKYFKYKIVSGDVKCRKPEKRIYELTLEKINKKSSECYFIDNNVKNLDVAKELGISPILFNRDDEQYEGVIVNSFEELVNIIEK